MTPIFHARVTNASNMPVTAQQNMCHHVLTGCRSRGPGSLRCKQAYCSHRALSFDPAAAQSGTADATLQYQFAQQPTQQQRPRTAPLWRAPQQKYVLAASAVGAPPLLLLLDVAEQASLALFHLQALICSRPENHQHPGHPQHLQQQQQGASVQHQHKQEAKLSDTTYSSYKRGLATSSTLHARPFLDLWPPWIGMASAALPPMLLALRHHSDPTAMHLLLAFLLSMLGQAYLQLGLALLATTSRQATAARAASTAAAAATARASIGNGEPPAIRWYCSAPAGVNVESGPEGTSIASAEVQNSRQDGVAQSRQQRHRYKQLRSSASPLHYFFPQRMLPVIGDSVRLVCLCYAAHLVLPAAVAALVSATGCLLNHVAMLQAPDFKHTLAIVAVAAVHLHNCANALFWFMTDAALFAVSIGVCCLAVLGRLLPAFPVGAVA